MASLLYSVAGRRLMSSPGGEQTSTRTPVSKQNSVAANMERIWVNQLNDTAALRRRARVLQRLSPRDLRWFAQPSTHDREPAPLNQVALLQSAASSVRAYRADSGRRQ